MPRIGDKTQQPNQLVFSVVKLRSKMTDLQPPPIGLTRVFSNIFPTDRLAIVNDSHSIHGSSLLAKTPFRRGELILPLMGTLCTRSYRTIQIDVFRHLDGVLVAFMNHSCRPTAIVQAQALSVRAAVDLKEGDEITFFYPSTEWDMLRPFECLCRARDWHRLHCRRTISVDRHPQALFH
jgi:hypothetical protein